WWLPWMTQWRGINRLRAIVEHGGPQARPDPRGTPHHPRQSPPRPLPAVPPPHRPPVPAGPVLVRPLQHRMAPGPPRRHGRSLPEPAGVPCRAGAGRVHHRHPDLPELPVPVEGTQRRLIERGQRVSGSAGQRVSGVRYRFLSVSLVSPNCFGFLLFVGPLSLVNPY